MRQNSSIEASEELLATAQSVRSFLEPLWMDCHADRFDRILLPLSGGMCRFTAEFLARNARDLGMDGWTVRGGIGCWRDQQEGESHYCLSNGSLILDLTADQFDGVSETVLLTTVDDPRYGNLDPVTSTSLVAQAYIDRTLWWDRVWRTRNDTDAAQDVYFTLANLMHWLGDGAAAFAVMFARDADLSVFRSRAGGPEFLAGHDDGRMMWDAAGLLPNDQIPADAEQLTDDEIRTIETSLADSAMESAGRFASSHSHLMDMARYAACARIEYSNAGIVT